MKTTFTFREITQANELEQWLRLRYITYANTPNRVFINENRYRLDLDHFDTHSRHFGICCGNQQAGYLRAVYPQSELVCQAATDIMAGYPVTEITTETHPKAPFPFLTHPGVPDCYWSYYEAIQRKRGQLIEGSRLIVLPGYRGNNLANWLISCGLSVCLTDYSMLPYSLITNCSSHQRMAYAAYGFKPIGSVTEYQSCGMPKVTMALPVNQLANSFTSYDTIRTMVNQFSTNHFIEKIV